MLVPAESLESILADLIQRQISTLAASHPGKRFYGFAVDSNITFGGLHVSANTREDLREHCARVYGGGQRDLAHEEELLWQSGDWSYKCFDRGNVDWESRWNPIGESIATASADLYEDDEEAWDEWKEAFMWSVCRVLINLQTSGAFDSLCRDQDFRVFATDHDESIEAGEIRMDRVRASLAAHPR